MTASFGVFPLSVALGALVVHALGPAPFFPLAGAAVAVAILAGLTQRTWRDLGAAEPSVAAAGTRAVPSDSRAGLPAVTADAAGRA
jgi:hypothetical protein